MKIFPTKQTREEYLETQITRSSGKFDLCKVSSHDVAKYKIITCSDRAKQEGAHLGPILCLGVKKGREVELFRLEFFGMPLIRYAMKTSETRTDAFKSRVPFLESIGRSDASNLKERSVVGVELNPRAVRSDIWIGSFDAMPQSWDHKFSIIFSNSFDQSLDPYSTAKEWRRVTRPGGYLIFCFSEGAEPTASDPVGNLQLADVLDLFGYRLIYFCYRGSRNGYSEVILRQDEF